MFLIISFVFILFFLIFILSNKISRSSQASTQKFPWTCYEAYQEIFFRKFSQFITVFSSDSDADASRFWVWIDADTGEALKWGIHETCVVGGECEGPRPQDCTAFNNCIESNPNDDGSITLQYSVICDSYGAYDALCSMKPNGEITFTPNDSGGFDIEMDVNDFPNLEAYYWEDGELNQTLFQIENFSDSSQYYITTYATHRKPIPR